MQSAEKYLVLLDQRDFWNNLKMVKAKFVQVKKHVCNIVSLRDRKDNVTADKHWLGRGKAPCADPPGFIRHRGSTKSRFALSRPSTNYFFHLSIGSRRKDTHI